MSAHYLLTAVLWIATLVNINKAQIHRQEGLTLIEGTSTQGVLMLRYSGRSGFLCAHGIGREVGMVACRDLGLPSQHPSIRPVQAPVGTAFMGSHMQCHGDEIKLADCHHADWSAVSSCHNGEAVYLSCQADPCDPSPCKNGGQCEPMSSDLGYRCNCTSAWTGVLCDLDVDECTVHNGGCSDICVNVDGGYSCECPQQELTLGPDNHTCSAPGEEVSCGSDVMELTLEKQHFTSLHKEHLTLSDVSCGATDNATHIIIRAPLGACGTVRQQSGSTIIYSNVIHSLEEVVDGVITRVKEVEIPFQCVMSLEEIREIPITVDTGELNFLLEGSGHHDVSLQLTSVGTSPQGQGHPVAYPGQQIQGQVGLVTTDPNLRVALSNCSATTTVVHNSTATPYRLLTNGCANDTTLVLNNLTDSTHQSFHLEAFKFLDNSPNVFLHCDVMLCDDADLQPGCSQGCLASH